MSRLITRYLYLFRLVVNLTTPALILWNEVLPTEKSARNHYMSIEDHLQKYKAAFADESVWAVLYKKISKILELVSLNYLFYFYKIYSTACATEAKYMYTIKIKSARLNKFFIKRMKNKHMV